jgi:hypothetical protein
VSIQNQRLGSNQQENHQQSVDVRNPTRKKHNHNPSSGPSSHAAQKKLIPKQFEEIQKLSQSNLKPAQILLQLQTSDNKTYATNKTVSNALQRIRGKDLAGRTPIEALLCVFKETNWSFDVKVKENGAIENVFLVTPAPFISLGSTITWRFWI